MKYFYYKGEFFKPSCNSTVTFHGVTHSDNGFFPLIDVIEYTYKLQHIEDEDKDKILISFVIEISEQDSINFEKIINHD